MAEGPYRQYGAGTGPFFYHQQNHTRNRNGSPVNAGRNIYSNDTPSPSRSPVSQSSSHPFAMFSQTQTQQAMMNGSGHQRYMQMNTAQKYQQQGHQQHHTQQNHHHQQTHGGHPGHGMGHQHTYSGGMSLNSGQAFNSSLQNGPPTEDHVDLGEPASEHWQLQMQLASESRTNVSAHKHCKRKDGATLISTRTSQPSTDEPQREGEPVERNRAMAVQVESRQDWDGIDMSFQGLRCLSMRLFESFSFLTKLFIDGNKLTTLSPAISHLRNLVHLQASQNLLTEIPDTIGMLSKLEQLLVFDNHITHLPAEIGYLFKLEVLGIDGNPIDSETREFIRHNGTPAYVTHVRDNTPAGPPPVPRKRIILDDSEAPETFTILDHNILCEKYATSAQYKYTPTDALQWPYRRDLILEDLKNYDPDVICLQEVDQESFEFFRRELAYSHYKGAYWQKSRARTMAERDARLVDGCAIFYKGPKFILLDKKLIDFANTAINRQDMKGEDDIFNRVMPRDHIAVAAFLENRMTGSRMIVANAHVFWDPAYNDVKLVQTAILMDQITKFSDSWALWPPCSDKTMFRYHDQDSENEPDASDTPAAEPAPSLEYSTGSQIPLIICGDFNSARGTAVYQLLSDGSIPPDHPDIKGRSYGTFTREGMAHPFKLRSAYSGEHGDYIEFTNYTPGFVGLIDYIWHSSSLRRRQLLGNVDFNYLQKVPGFPDYHFPSDHLALFAEFSVDQRKERGKVVEADFGGNGSSQRRNNNN